MEEAHRTTIDLVAALPPNDLAPVDVPVRQVDARVAQDDVIEVAGHEVDPPLVDEPHGAGIDDAVAAKAFPPPIEELERPCRHGEKAEVVDAGGQNVEFRRAPPVSRHGRGGMRCQHDRVLIGGEAMSKNGSKTSISGSRYIATGNPWLRAHRSRSGFTAVASSFRL